MSAGCRATLVNTAHGSPVPGAHDSTGGGCHPNGDSHTRAHAGATTSTNPDSNSDINSNTDTCAGPRGQPLYLEFHGQRHLATPLWCLGQLFG